MPKRISASWDRSRYLSAANSTVTLLGWQGRDDVTSPAMRIHPGGANRFLQRREHLDHEQPIVCKSFAKQKMPLFFRLHLRLNPFCCSHLEARGVVAWVT